jgi:hypothetical protein
MIDEKHPHSNHTFILKLIFITRYMSGHKLVIKLVICLSEITLFANTRY